MLRVIAALVNVFLYFIKLLTFSRVQWNCVTRNIFSGIFTHFLHVMHVNNWLYLKK